MAENSTRPTGASVEEYIASRANDQQRADCHELMDILARVTGEEPAMWGPSIVGYGSYRYRYESGRTGEAPLVGFAIRGREIVLYLLMDGDAQQDLLARVGSYRMGKACFYFKRLADLDHSLLEKLIAGSVADLRLRYPPDAAQAN